MYTITLKTNSLKLKTIFENEITRLNIGTTSCSTKKDFMEHLFSLSLYVLSGTECNIEGDTIETGKLDYKKRFTVKFNIN